MVQLTLFGGGRLADPPVMESTEGSDSDVPREHARETETASTSQDANGAPALASIHRIRKPKRKPPEGPRGRSKLGRLTKETNVDLTKRLVQFPGQSLVISAGKLFCKACKEEQPNLKESIKRHLLTTKHREMLKAHEKNMDRNSSLVSDLAEYFENKKDEQGVRRQTPHRPICLVRLTLSATPRLSG